MRATAAWNFPSSEILIIYQPTPLIMVASRLQRFAREMRQILTSDQFVAGVIAVLALQNRKRFVLKETELDERFEKAFEELLSHEDQLKIATNFTFYVDPMHGDSVCLRDTLLAAREKALISINNPTLQTFDIKIDDDRALRYLKRIPLPRAFLTDLVNKHFSDLGTEAA